MRAVWTIARRELNALFDHPMGYILLVVFIAINNFLFFAQAYQLGVAELRPMLGLLPWLFLFFIPAVTMRALAEDLRSGTIEVVLAQPITELELLIGKYVGQVLFIWIALGLTLAIPLGFSIGADLHLGVIFAQYVGSALFAAGFAAIGLWASSLGNTQITAFIVGVAVMFLFVFMGLDMLVTGLPPVLATVAANLGVLAHFENISRGVVDLRDVVYFVTLSAVFLVLAYGALIGRKLAPKGDALKRMRTGTIVLVVTLIVVNLFGRHIGGRLDFTPGNVYTLSRATRDIARNLHDIVTIKLFVSRELPPQIALSKRDIDDLLSDLRSAGGGNIRVIERDPAEDEEVANDARSLGIMPVQFNVVGQDQLTVQEGYMGLAVQYADETETIPLIRTTDDLEYRLASYIRTLTREAEPLIGLVAEGGMSIPGQQAQGPTYNTIRGALDEMYEVRNVNLSTEMVVPGEFSALVLAGSPPMIEDSVAAKVQAYLQGGGNALVMASGMQLSPQMQQPFAGPTPVAWNQVLEPYGVSVGTNMVFDLLANERVSVPANFGRIFVSYPFWLRGLSTKAASVNQEIESVFMPWSSEVDTAEAAAGTITPLFVTSNAGGVESGQAYIDPRRTEFPQNDLASRLVGVMVNPANAVDGAEDDPEPTDETSMPTAPAGRVVVLGNGEFATDQWVRNAPQNVTFVLNTVDWLVQDEGLIGIRSKDRSPPPLVFESATLRDFVRYGNVYGIPLLIVIAAIVRLLKRRQAKRQQYVPFTRQEVT
jgi:ABC-type uncharacterized transport system involved in gliding motility auxiliary subunit/ABC-type transport system involved in multi-copper enzyme maturation permease subunit